jgi:hypothetical protein
VRANVASEGKNEDNDVVMMTTIEEEIVSMETALVNMSDGEEIWIGDTGATAHMTNSVIGLSNVRYVCSEIKLGDGNCVESPFTGDKCVTVKQEDGRESTIVLRDCKYVPALFTNLLSLTRAMKSGWNLYNEELDLVLSNGKEKLKLSKAVKNKNGYLLGLRMKPKESETALILKMESMDKTKIEINELHQKLGHPGEKNLLGTAKNLEMMTFRKLLVCKDCAIGKAKQKNLNQVNANKSNVPRERIYLDISSVSQTSFGRSKYWILIVDKSTRMKWCFFVKSKSDFTLIVGSFIKRQIKDEKIVKFIQCDNSGENQKLKEFCDQEGLKIKFEFTVPHTPQQNSVVEHAFATLYGRVRAMLQGSSLDKDLREGLWTECTLTATLLDNILSDGGDKCPHEKFYGIMPSYARNLKTFGEQAIVTDRMKIKGKLTDRGVKCIFVGYCQDHPDNEFRFFKLETKGIIRLRDIIWINNLN